MKSKYILFGALGVFITLTSAQRLLAQSEMSAFRCANTTNANEPQSTVLIGQDRVIWDKAIYQNLRRVNNPDGTSRSFVLQSANVGVVTIDLKMLSGLPGGLRYTIEETWTQKNLAEFNYQCIKQ